MSLPKDIKITSECPVCKAESAFQDVEIMQQFPGAQLAHVVCQKCQGALVVLVTQTALGVNSFGILTDLKKEEVNKFVGREAITADDILKIRGTLNN